MAWRFDRLTGYQHVSNMRKALHPRVCMAVLSHVLKIRAVPLVEAGGQAKFTGKLKKRIESMNCKVGCHVKLGLVPTIRAEERCC